MEVVTEAAEIILVTEETSEIVREVSSEYVLVESNNGNTVVVQSNGNIVTDNPTTSVVVTGLIGPAGIPEEDIMYSKRVDFISDEELYRGEAVVGSSESSAVWRIRKITMSPDVVETWASGNANFDKIWANRLALSYS